MKLRHIPKVAYEVTRYNFVAFSESLEVGIKVGVGVGVGVYARTKTPGESLSMRPGGKTEGAGSARQSHD
jgi:hypothetical protein